MGDALTVTTVSQEQTKHLGEALGEILHPGDVLLLSGALGAGKTLFAKGVAMGVGVVDEITSPTFTIVAEYGGRSPFVHMDLYRLYRDDNLNSSDKLSLAALDSIGFESYLDGESILLIEWPQGVVGYFDEAIWIEINIPDGEDEHHRVIFARAVGEQSMVRLNEWVTQWQF